MMKKLQNEGEIVNRLPTTGNCRPPAANRQPSLTWQSAEPEDF